MEDIRKLWERHEAAPFPSGWRGKKLAGVDLTLMESILGGHIMSAVELDGNLSSRATKEFEQYRGILSEVIEEIDQNAREYFVELKNIVDQLSPLLKKRAP